MARRGARFLLSGRRMGKVVRPVCRRRTGHRARAWITAALGAGIAAGLAVGCAADEGADAGEQPGTGGDGGGVEGDVDGGTRADGGAPAGPPGLNEDITTVVVWSQNIRMGLERWQNAVRCMGDAACNGLGAVPDIVLLQEASCENVKAMQALMAAPREEGGLGIGGWKRVCADNPSSGGVTGHWMSNGIIYRGDRFRIEGDASVRRVEFFTGDGTFCARQGKVLPIVKLLDLPRAEADKLERRVTVAVRHDDHFGAGGKNTCPAPDAPTVFCAWKNSKLIDEEIAAMGGGLLVMGGDWNYAARYCVYDGEPTTNFKYAYACTTEGLRDDCAPANLGWRDPILDHDPTFYDERKAIDFLHGKDIGEVSLNQTARHDLPGVIGKHFYCDGHGPYDAGGVDDHPERMTDHHARLMRFQY